MPWGAAIAAVGAIGGAYMQGQAGEAGADAQASASAQATAEQRRQYDQTRTDMLPWLEAGRGALNQQQAVLAGDYSGFMNSPDYLWAKDQSLKALERGAAARGGFMGGGADADRIELAGGLATQNLGNYWNKLSGMSNTGSGTATNLGQFGANMANQVGGNMMNAGQVRASSYANSANAWSNALQQGASAFGQYYGGRG